MAVYRESRPVVREPGTVDEPLIVERTPAASQRGVVRDPGAGEDYVVVERAPAARTRRVVREYVVDGDPVVDRPPLTRRTGGFDVTPEDLLRYGLIAFLVIVLLYLLGTVAG